METAGWQNIVDEEEGLSQASVFVRPGTWEGRTYVPMDESDIARLRTGRVGLVRGGLTAPMRAHSSHVKTGMVSVSSLVGQRVHRERVD